MGAKAPEVVSNIVFNDYQPAIRAALAGEGIALG